MILDYFFTNVTKNSSWLAWMNMTNKNSKGTSFVSICSWNPNSAQDAKVFLRNFCKPMVDGFGVIHPRGHLIQCGWNLSRLVTQHTQVALACLLHPRRSQITAHGWISHLRKGECNEEGVTAEKEGLSSTFCLKNSISQFLRNNSYALVWLCFRPKTVTAVNVDTLNSVAGMATKPGWDRKMYSPE